jgi:hypothetical protein
MRWIGIILTLLAVAALSACGGRRAPAPTATPAPEATATVAVAATPLPTVSVPLPITTYQSPISVTALSPLPMPVWHAVDLSTGRAISALDAYPAAEAAAKAWHVDAFFVGIEPSHIMEGSLPDPPAAAGWFYRFARPDGDLEYYVQVIDGAVALTTEARRVGFTDDANRPLDVAAVRIDSGDAREAYVGSVEDREPSDAELDYALVVEPTSGRTLWLVYELAHMGTVPAMAIDAVTGEIVP